MKKYTSTMIVLITIASVVVLAWKSMNTYMDLRTKELRIRAVEGCLSSSKYQFEDKDKGVTTVEPMKEPYEKCMKEKGY